MITLFTLPSLRVARRLAFPFISLFALLSLAAESAESWQYIRFNHRAINLDESDPRKSVVDGGLWIWHAEIEGEGKLYFAAGGTQSARSLNLRSLQFVIQLPSDAPMPINGRLLIGPQFGETPLEPGWINFTLDPEFFHAAERSQSIGVMAGHYNRLLARRFPGSSWFLAKIRELEAESGREYLTAFLRNQGRVIAPADRSFQFFSGGLAIIENLALNDELTSESEQDPTIDITTIQGITLPEIEWTDLMEDPFLKLEDPLFKLVPYNQYLLLLPSREAIEEALLLLDQGSANLTHLFRGFSAEPTDFAIYREQLGWEKLRGILGTDQASDLRLAITGGDLFFASGTDVVLLIESSDPKSLLPYLPEDVPHELMGSVLVISNRAAALSRIKQVFEGGIASLASLDETRFFRERYAASPDEMAFFYISDAALRRWTSPSWRIAEARRRIAQAQRLRELAQGGFPAGAAPDPVFGAPPFLLPLSEVAIEKVTRAEERAYLNWRRGYEARWPAVFDPIALQVRNRPEGLKLDLSVIPLTRTSLYRNAIDLTGEASIDARFARTGPEPLLQLDVALDVVNSTLFQDIRRTAEGGLGQQVDLLSWVGDTLSLRFEDDPRWELVAESEAPARMWRELMRAGQRPVTVALKSTNGLALASTLSTLRAFVQTSAPGLIEWETLEHNGIPYVRVGQRGSPDLQAFYATLPDRFLLSLSEDSIKARLLETVLSARITDRAPLGQHINLRLNPKAFRPIASYLDNEAQIRQTREHFERLPLLSELAFASDQSLSPAEAWEAFFGSPLPAPKALPGTFLRLLESLEAGITFDDLDGLRAKIAITRSQKSD